MYAIGIDKAGSHLTFAFTSPFQEHVKFLFASCQCKHYVQTLPLAAVDPILEIAHAEHSYCSELLK